MKINYISILIILILSFSITGCNYNDESEFDTNKETLTLLSVDRIISLYDITSDEQSADASKQMTDAFDFTGDFFTELKQSFSDNLENIHEEYYQNASEEYIHLFEDMSIYYKDIYSYFNQKDVSKKNSIEVVASLLGEYKDLQNKYTGYNNSAEVLDQIASSLLKFGELQIDSINIAPSKQMAEYIIACDNYRNSWIEYYNKLKDEVFFNEDIKSTENISSNNAGSCEWRAYGYVDTNTGTAIQTNISIIPIIPPTSLSNGFYRVVTTWNVTVLRRYFYFHSCSYWKVAAGVAPTVWTGVTETFSESHDQTNYIWRDGTSPFPTISYEGYRDQWYSLPERESCPSGASCNTETCTCHRGGSGGTN